MPDLRELLPAAGGYPLCEARFTRDITDVSDGAFVRYEAEGWDDVDDGPCPWTPRVDGDGDVLLPNKGDRCLVAMSDENTPWVVAWWPRSHDQLDFD